MTWVFADVCPCARLTDDNPLNPEAYYRTLGPELWEGTDGTITHFVAAGSTGGTVSGSDEIHHRLATLHLLRQVGP